MPRPRKSRTKVKRKDEIPEVYKEMLAEAGASSSAFSDESGRRVKRRRIGGRIVTQGEQPVNASEQEVSPADSHDGLDDLFEEVITQRPSIIKSDSEDSASNNQDWEEVDLQPRGPDQSTPGPETDDNEELNLVLENDEDATSHTPGKEARKPMTSREKELRLNIHKTHLCCLLAHVFLRNHFCNDESLYPSLRRVLNKKTISYLNPSENMTQFQRSRSFMSGLEQASEVFRQRFKIVSRGMSRPFWASNADALAKARQPTDIELPMMKEDFKAAAQQLQASRDVGAQLFCALLRSVGVDSRLVCSLQILSFNSDSSPAATAESKYAEYYQTDFWPGRRSSESGSPVYWVEAFNEAVQKWVPVDPLVTKSIAKPSKIEPPAGDQQNKLNYVIAFEEDGSAHDVTRRYAKAYNAKTRKDRVENTKGGDRWWRRAMRLYQRRYRLDRDQVDDAELSKKEASEPMPRNVQDFKYHPYYALERHLRRHEVIYPKREVGKVSIGRSRGTAALEPIFRRRDVHHVQSADQWYRKIGREIKLGEQPLKRIPARKNRDRSVNSDDEVEENTGTSLYAMHQTTPYTAPPVQNGRVPKNIYGNIDIYVPTMIPPGGSHVKHPDTIRAAKILGIDFAEAVTGFVFRGRHGTAVSQGAIIASEYYDAVEAVLAALEDERLQAEEAQKSREALRMWKRLLAGLRIRERIEGYTIEGERDDIERSRSKSDETEDVPSDSGGGFFPAQEAEDFAEPMAHKSFRQQDEIGDFGKEDGEFTVDDTVNQNQDAALQASDRFLDNLEDDDGGGFLIEDDHDEDAEQALESAMKNNSTAQQPRPTTASRHSPVQRANIRPGEQKDIPSEVEASTGEIGIMTNEPLRKNQSFDEHGLRDGLSQAELDEARLVQHVHESQQSLANPPAMEGSTTAREPPSTFLDEDKKKADRDPSEIVSNAADPAPLIQPTSAVLSTTSEAESPQSDKGSLLSEDPEDEDAEPDWLL